VINSTNTYTRLLEPFLRARRKERLGIGLLVAALFCASVATQSWMGAQDRADAANWRAWKTTPTTQVTDAVGARIVEFLRSVELLDETIVPQNLTASGVRNERKPALHSLRLIVSYISGLPETKRASAVKRLVEIGLATTDNGFLNTLNVLEALPTATRDAIRHSGGQLLQSFHERLKKETDLIEVRKSINNELAKYRCELDALEEQVLICLRKRNIEPLRTR
jgi:hypothetical protein